MVDNSHKTLKSLKNEIVDNDEILNIVIEKLEGDKTIKDLTKDYPDNIKNLEEALLNYMGEIDLKLLKTGFPDKWKNSTKIFAKPYEFFNNLDVYNEFC